MSRRQELLEYIQNLTPEQVDKIVSQLPLLKGCLATNDPLAVYADAFPSKLLGGMHE